MKKMSRIEPVAPLEADVRGLPRAPEDDFFCVRYQVWYPSFDCAVRTRFRTSGGCLNCDQGRFNERRHATALALTRIHLPDDEDGTAAERDVSGGPRDRARR